MEEMQKIYKVFTLIRLLNTPPARDAKQLMRMLGVKKTHFYRLLKLLKELGYKIKKNERHRMSFETSVSEYGNGVIESEELAHLEYILQQVDKSHPLTISLINKFNANLSLIPLADSLPQLHANRNIQLIRNGINRGTCVLLKNYQSLTSNTQKDRKIEPLELTDDYRYLIGWEPEIDRQGQFKISRIGDVKVLDEPIKSGRNPTFLDIFGLTGEEWLNVKLELSPFAHYMMVEEFPLSVQFINSRRNPIIFDGRVKSWKGIGRFVLGLMGEIKVLEPQSFKNYLSEKIANFKI